MRTRKQRGSLVLAGMIVVGAMLLATSGSVRAQPVVASDQEAGILVFPKIVVDTAGVLNGGKRVDTIIQITNTDSVHPNGAPGPAPHAVHCVWVTATGSCGGAGDVPCDPDDPTTCATQPLGLRTCVPSWNAGPDFTVTLTAAQPIAFRASDPMPSLACQGTANPCANGDSQGALLPAPGNPFVGELKCVEVSLPPTTGTGTDQPPVLRNDLKGEARIYTLTSGTPGSVDVRSYNAIGIQADPNAYDGSLATDVPGTLCLGDSHDAECPVKEYAGCPDALILNNFFEGAEPDPSSAAGTVDTRLTLVPCTENLEAALPTQIGPTQVRTQLAIFNEFEQRFSSNLTVECFLSTRLADIDTLPGSGDDATSIFSVGVQGTLTGQTRIRGVPANADGHGLLGIAEEFYAGGFSDAFNLHYDMERSGVGDVIRILP
jgi:hypothetical protein